MSGGHWGYEQFKIEERAEWLAGLLRFMAAAEHELDWGTSHDTCWECAKRRVPEAMARFFDGDVDAALAVLRDREQNQCRRCRMDPVNPIGGWKAVVRKPGGHKIWEATWPDNLAGPRMEVETCLHIAGMMHAVEPPYIIEVYQR